MNDNSKEFELNDEDIGTVSGGGFRGADCPFGRSDFSFNTLCNGCENRENIGNFTFACKLGVPGSYNV